LKEDWRKEGRDNSEEMLGRIEGKGERRKGEVGLRKGEREVLGGEGHVNKRGRGEKRTGN